ncbi:gibberellin 20-oxidase-like protein isoform X2 [Momordica charantia]|uniref:Gibberellin 20-oxidase-like protein isoform X2 n=1 Tax=Momordica charantia TaxID=3673 RepID=A0A6J1CHI8_MOMCH|nr:gibberellin 20-oxidase-like protein isoform X2 [Momordica charantia]
MSESQTCVELPVIDLSQPLSESILCSLCAACNEWGFFYITNHGVSDEFYQKLISIADELFRLPQDTKIKVGISSYVPRFTASPFFESFKLSGPDFSASAQLLTEALLGHHNTQFRINNYSPRDSNEEVEGLGKHTDISCVTILFQDKLGGLQMRSKGGEWMDIRPCENALVVNIGDFMQAWSNERLRSAEHRVVLRQNVKRFSMAFFWSYVDDEEIYAPSEVVGEGNVRLYRTFSTKEYRMFRATGARGTYEKVGANVKEFAGIVG